MGNGEKDRKSRKDRAIVQSLGLISEQVLRQRRTKRDRNRDCDGANDRDRDSDRETETGRTRGRPRSWLHKCRVFVQIVNI